MKAFSDYPAGAAFKKEWLRLSRSRAGRFGPAGLAVIFSFIVFMGILGTINGPDMLITSTRLTREMSETREALGLWLFFSLLFTTVLTLSSGMMAVDLVHEERRTGTLQALRLTPLKPLEVISAKTLGALAFQLHLFLVMLPLYLLVTLMTGVSLDALGAVALWAIFSGLAFCGLSAALTASTSGTLGKAALSVISILLFMFSLGVVEGVTRFGYGGKSFVGISPLAILGVLLTGFAIWGFGAISASRKLFNPAATPLSPGQAALGGLLVQLMTCLLLVTPPVRDLLTEPEIKVFFCSVLAVFGMAVSWFALGQCIPARHGQSLDWNTMDGWFNTPLKVLCLSLLVLTVSHLITPVILMPDFASPALLVAAGQSIGAFLLWFSAGLWICMLITRTTGGLTPYVLWVLLPLMLLIFYLLPSWGRVVPFAFHPYTFPVGLCERNLICLEQDHFLESTISQIWAAPSQSAWSQAVPLLGIEAIFFFLAYLIQRLPLPKPKTPILPKDFKPSLEV